MSEEGLRRRALELRKSGDLAWDEGKKDESDQYHREAAKLEKEADAYKLDFSKEAAPLDGFKGVSLAPGQEARCVNQDHAAQRVRTQVEKMVGRLDQKHVFSVFSTVLYTFNCDRHGGHSSHVDLVTTGLDNLKPEGLAQTIAATEALLVAMKKRIS